MSFRGKFEWYNSIQQGGKKAITFTLTCKNMFMRETFDCAIMDSSGQQPSQIRRRIKLKPKESFVFNYDTCGWDWCIGDFFAIIDSNNDNILERWDVDVKVYGRGECPECHGSHRCSKCNGTGIMNNPYTHTMSQCPVCSGTGLCQTCYVPVRYGSTMYNEIYSNGSIPNPNLNKQYRIEALQRRISELQKMIERAEWNERMMQLRRIDKSMGTTFMHILNQKVQYEQQIIQLQHQLDQLSNMNI